MEIDQSLDRSDDGVAPSRSSFFAAAAGQRIRSHEQEPILSLSIAKVSFSFLLYINRSNVREARLCVTLLWLQNELLEILG